MPPSAVPPFYHVDALPGVKDLRLGLHAAGARTGWAAAGKAAVSLGDPPPALTHPRCFQVSGGLS